jgi:hypothetical protein
MTIVRVLADGAGEAIKLVPLLFTLNAPQAHAHLPRAVPVQAAAEARAALEPVDATTAPRLVARHLSLAVAEDGATLRTALVFRNESGAPVAARYTLPFSGAIVQHGVDDAETGGASPAADGCGDPFDDETAAASQFLEAGEPDPRAAQGGVVWLAPGDEVTLVTVRAADLLRRDTRLRVVVPLPAPDDKSYTPRFSADVSVDAGLPVVALRSATHGGTVDGLGGSHALLTIDDGRVHEARFFAVEAELGRPPAQAAPTWGGEARHAVLRARR